MKKRQKNVKIPGDTLFKQSDAHTVEDLEQIYLLDFERVIEKMRSNIHTYVLPYLKYIPPEELEPEDF